MKVAHTYADYITEDLLEEHKEELEKYFPDNNKLKEKFAWNLDKLKILLLLRYPRGSNELEKILSFLEPSSLYGWQEHKKEGYVYRLINPCFSHFRNGLHCKRKVTLKTSELAEVLFDIQEIFLGNNAHSSATLFIFSYCLASLFGSIINYNGFNFPFVLQIACDRKTKTYELIKEIVSICDVNLGLINNCKIHSRQLEGYCYTKPKVFYPAGSFSSSIDDLVSNMDVPIIIDGDGRMKNFNALLKEIANIPIKRSRLGLKDRFKLLPIFVSPSIDHNYDNVFTMDLSNIDTNQEYLDLISEHKNILSSWVSELVLEFGSQLKKLTQSNDSQINTDSFLRSIRDTIDHIHTQFTRATADMVKHIGYLSFFFKAFMMVVDDSIMLEADDPIEALHNKQKVELSSHELIRGLITKSYATLLKSHIEYSLLQMQPGKIDTSDISTKGKVMATANHLAAIIKEHYEAHKVYFDIIKYDVKDEKYTLHIRPAKGTSYKKINRHAEDVRQSMNIEVLEVQSSDGATSIILSEKPLDEKSLVKILDSKEFKESKAIIPYAVGYESSGDMVISDVTNYPHMLIGGTTKSGKSTALYSLLLSIITKKGADEVNIIIFDYGKTELILFNKIPHLSRPIIGGGDYETGFLTISALESEMYRRRQIYKEDRKTFDKLPYIVCIIDEFRLFINGLPSKEDKQILQDSIMNLLSLARGFKIHLILATQNPTIRNIRIDPANLDAKLALRCANQYQSKSILGYGGAENLPGRGAMIFHSDEHPVDKRLQGSFIDDNGKGKESELAIKIGSIDFNYDYDDTYKFVIEKPSTNESIPKSDKSVFASPNQKSHDEALAKAIMMTLKRKEIAISHIMKNCGVAYPRASKLIKKLHEFGLVDEERPNKPRKTISKTVDEITSSNEIMKILTAFKYTTENIEEEISKGISG